MPIGDQFAGLDMKNLIGAPLSAAADASVELANSTADFINKVGFDSNGNTRTAEFKFQQMGKNEDGSLEQQEMKVDVPLLAIVPIPNLQVDEVNILFDMEVKQSERSESASDYGGSFSGTANFGIIKVSVSGSVSSHSSNTRSTDNSAKYHVDVSATNHGTPEGLARVLDMMAGNVAPTISGSTAVDESGQPLTGDRKSKNDSLKRLRLKKSQFETAYNAAEKAFDTAVANLKREATNRHNSFAVSLQSKINAIDTKKESPEEKAAAEKRIADYTNMGQHLAECWNNFQNTVRDAVASVASSDVDAPVTSIFQLEGLGDDSGEPKLIKYTAADESTALTTLAATYQKSISSYKQVLKIKEDLDKADMEYNELIYGVSTAER